jgi:dihydrofolate reductase
MLNTTSGTKVMPSESEETPFSNMLPLELTLIVAATRNMGIGRAGTLPWTGLKKEMAYFARVTKRIDDMPSNSLDSTVRAHVQVGLESN